MSKRMSRYPSDRKVYVGDLGNNARKNEIEYVFSSYGTLRSVWVARNPPGFAFVEFEDSRDAADAVRGLDGRTVCGRRARVELSTGKYGNKHGDREDRGGGGGGGRDRERRGGSRSRGKPFNPDDKCYECGGRGHYARDCRRFGKSKKRSHSRSRSKSHSRDHRTRSRTGSRSNSKRSSRSGSAESFRSRRGAAAPRENGHRNGAARVSAARNGASRSPKRRFNASPRRSQSNEIPVRGKTTRRSRSISRRRVESRSRSRSRS